MSYEEIHARVSAKAIGTSVLCQETKLVINIEGSVTTLESLPINKPGHMDTQGLQWYFIGRC